MQNLQVCKSTSKFKFQIPTKLWSGKGQLAWREGEGKFSEILPLSVFWFFSQCVISILIDQLSSPTATVSLKVIRYQKQLQLNYVQMYKRNKTLESEVGTKFKYLAPLNKYKRLGPQRKYKYLGPLNKYKCLGPQSKYKCFQPKIKHKCLGQGHQNKNKYKYLRL